MLKILNNENDDSTKLLIEYCNYFKVSFDVINTNKTFEKISLYILNESKKVVLEDECESKYSILSSEKIWFRRGAIVYKFPFNFNDISDELKKFLNFEYELLHESIFRMFNVATTYSQEKYNNRLVNLKLATDMGISIPSSLVTTLKSDAIRFIEQYKNVITKPIHNIAFNTDLNTQKRISSKGSQIVSLNTVVNMHDQFAPSLLQEYIDKSYEVRSFVYYEEIFSVAIFSQSNEKTLVDYRNYDNEFPNRYITYRLPDELRNSIISLMSKIGLKTGSIDFIVDKNENHYFLEINPLGQFGFISKNCNLNIEKSIVKTWMN